MSRLPAPPNARVDGLDGCTAGLAAFLAREATPSVPAERKSGRGARVLLEARAREARRRRTRRTTGAGAALGALAAAGLVAWTAARHLPPSALSYTVDGATPPRDGYVRSSAAHEPELAFSDGTSIHMMPKARARVVEVGSRGARVVLEQGRAHVHVAHRPGADWQVQAGSFVVHVHGTAFFVEWSESRFDIQMESGVVSVDGPWPVDTVTLRAGQSLSVKPDGSRLVSLSTARPTPAGTAVPAAPTSLPEPAATTLPAPSTAPVPAPALGPSAAPASLAPSVASRALPNAAHPRALWSERLADGDAAGIVAEAQRRGLANVLRTASSEDLAALADAARFQMQDRLARRVLLAQRDRFPGTLRAKEASFLLGRLADGHGGERASDALGWYERYLDEAPSGAYAAEAMGRMIIVLERQQRMDQARAVAAAYLRRFPQGVYARTAREVTSR